MLNSVSVAFGLSAMFCGLTSMIHVGAIAERAFVAMILFSQLGLLTGALSRQSGGRNLNLIVVLVGAYLLCLGRSTGYGAPRDATAMLDARAAALEAPRGE